MTKSEKIGETPRRGFEGGYCVGVSAGANMLATRRLRQRGSVITVWPDCANRYGSMGLTSPSSEGACPLKDSCIEKTRRLLRPDVS